VPGFRADVLADGPCAAVCYGNLDSSSVNCLRQGRIAIRLLWRVLKLALAVIGIHRRPGVEAEITPGARSSIAHLVALGERDCVGSAVCDHAKGRGAAVSMAEDHPVGGIAGRCQPALVPVIWWGGGVLVVEIGRNNRAIGGVLGDIAIRLLVYVFLFEVREDMEK